ncbi:MAG TPA: LysR family transcriptional regulator [Chloroflexota bacterium]|nr:LysR family transcriptional regulator [Chloroflexota bacterium]
MADEHAPLPELSLTRLRIFAAIVEQGGYSAAASSLALSQPTVSFHARALERAFGTRLLVYRDRRVQLTAAGQALYGLARRTLRDAEGLIDQIADLRAGRAGRVRLGASIAFEQAFFFEAVVAPFRRAHPDVELSLRFGHSVHMAEAVRAREVDLAYVARWHVPGDVQYEPLHPSRVVFFVAADHPLAAAAVVSFADVARAGLIAAPLDSVEWQYYGAVLREAGLRHYRVALEVDGIQARILAAQAGLGVLGTFWPPYVREPVLPGLCALRLPTAPAGPDYGLLGRDEAAAAPVVTAFADWLRHVATAP